MIDGPIISMGGRDWTIPPLNLKQVRKLGPMLLEVVTSLGQASDSIPTGALDAVVEVVHAAMKRNYPDLTVDEVEDMLDLGNMLAVIQAVMRVSGFMPVLPGELAGQAFLQSTGGMSTGQSSPEPDGRLPL